ncbi:hypothetical protein [Nocardiopsis ansamitocini]|uniref:DUF11 domain-containing protein n=1 Tax=Nocardiopsis ansamitocini TaxID=1670832 RepID=A0A9W6P5V8_9ACTN|nr:hypothetical protein [Nocardiopsis ansamitocini]GLU47617.1 hypothetical protein Nans01_19680 [Nocardiopsis ansamitocini]
MAVPRSIARGVAVSAVTAALLPPVPALADDRDPADLPALAISLTDSRDRIEPGEETDYTLTLRNDGERAVEGITLAQTGPPELEFRRPGEGGQVRGGAVTWQLSLEPGEEAVRTVTALMNETGSDVWRVAVTACAGLAADPAPIVCASDANLLPAATAADTAVRDTGLTGLPAPLLKAVCAAAALALLVAAAAGLLYWRRTSMERRAA